MWIDNTCLLVALLGKRDTVCVCEQCVMDFLAGAECRPVTQVFPESHYSGVVNFQWRLEVIT